MDVNFLGQKTPTRYFISNFFIISLIFIKNKCFPDVIWNLKKEKKSYPKDGFKPESIASNLTWHAFYHLHHEN